MASFVDRVVLHVSGGTGGHGCVSVKREKFKPLGGPDGGNGGNGGDVILRVDPQTTTLLSYHHAPHRHATNGGPGKGGMKDGTNGDSLVLPVPDGTVVKTKDGEVLADLTGAGTEYVASAGGQGGLGNAALASRKRKAPGFALLGVPGEGSDIVIELKIVADIALVGFPSAGKSSLVAAMSAARPKIAEYPFTTLVPNLGVVEAGSTRFTVADVPGLIPGASHGKGLGLEFLRHVERCAALVHILDCATLEPGRDPLSDLDALEKELEAYEVDASYAGAGDIVPLNQRPKLVALNKIDVPEAQELAEFVRPELEERGYQVFEISAAAHGGLRELTFAMANLVASAREAAGDTTGPARVVLRPKPVNESAFTIRREEKSGEPLFRVLGAKPVRWVQQTDFTNDEAVGFLADRLAKLGVEDQLFKVGAVPGSTVVIGEENAVVFDWEPTMVGGAEMLASSRGNDRRLEELTRPTREEKRELYQERKDARAATRADVEAERAAGIWSQDDSVEAPEEDSTEDSNEDATDPRN